MKTPTICLLVLIVCSSYGPPNCNLYKSDTLCYKACLEAEKAGMHGQGRKASQEHFNRSIDYCPSFDYSFYEKAVPFAKRGLIKEWKALIDKAVELNPKEHLANRGWYHYFFLHNYKAAIADIDRLDSLVSYDIGDTGDGYYHLNIIKAFCYKGLGNIDRAIEVFEDEMNREEHFVGAYDYLNLAVLYLNSNQSERCLDLLQKQKKVNDIAEIYFYTASAYKQLNITDSIKLNLDKSLSYYEKNKTMQNGYRQLPDEIYQSDIENAIAEL